MTMEVGSVSRHEDRTGTLSDDDIREMADAKKLITNGFTEGSLKQACYELRASDIYYRPPERERQIVESGESIIIGPKELVVIITMETISLPPDMLARVLTKGQLFSLGLSSVNTYADPGFDGRLGIVLYNTSTRYVSIAPGVPIAKMEVTKLQRPVSKPYKGAHGYHTELWPIMTEYYLKEDQIKTLRKEGKLESSIAALERAYGPDFGDVVRKLTKWYPRLFISMVFYMVCTIALIALNVGDVFNSALLNFGVGVGSSIAASLIFMFAAPRK